MRCAIRQQNVVNKAERALVLRLCRVKNERGIGHTAHCGREVCLRLIAVLLLVIKQIVSSVKVRGIVHKLFDTLLLVHIVIFVYYAHLKLAYIFVIHIDKAMDVLYIFLFLVYKVKSDKSAYIFGIRSYAGCSGAFFA